MSSSKESSSTERSELQVRTLLGEITQLSKRDITPEEFHAEFLRWVTAALGAVGGGLWTLERGTLSLSYQINFKELQLKENEVDKHARLLTRLLNSSENGTLLPPHSGTEGDNDVGNPTGHLLIFCPIRTELEVVGLVEIIHRPDAPINIQKNFVQFLAQTCKLATDYYKNRQLRHFSERQNLWVLLEDFTRTIHENLDPRLTAYTIANEGRRLIGCDRVSIALRRGNSCPIMAVSGQDTINKRATIVRLQGKVAGVVLKAGEPMWYAGSTSDFPPQIEHAVEKYVDESHSKMIAVFPLFHRKKEHEKEEEKEKKKYRKPLRPFGVLIVEQLTDSQITEQIRKRVDIVAEHASSALGNALEHRSIFLLPIWKLLGKSTQLLVGEALPKTIAVTIAVLIVLGCLLFLPWNFMMHSDGTLEPTSRVRIYSPIDAEIKMLFVEHGSRVLGPTETHRGTKLLELHSPELEAQGIQLQGEEREVLEDLVSLNQRLHDRSRQLSDFDLADLAGQISKSQIRLNTVRDKLDIFEVYQKPNLFITSPMDGVVISGDVRRRLTERLPLSRMSYVLEIADLDGDWQLELLVPESRMGYIMDQKRRQDALGEPLRVEFRLVSQPSVKHFGTVKEIYDRAEVRTDSGSASAMSSSINSVSIKVALDDLGAITDLRPGSECTARILCGKRPLGYVLFYELIIYFQKNILFRWF
ncbi:MAG: efflux RND transporter periplasmic adaptor subunit [Planctomycetaceae bacterium]|nr:efflux RND transporter periplasmic adaptor subunit [Planctomycetaceae bacterium]